MAEEKDPVLRVGCTIIALVGGVLLFLGTCSTISEQPPSPEEIAARDAAAAERLAGCRPIIERLLRSGELTQTSELRAEIDDRIWDELMADEKRNIAAGWACHVFDGRSIADMGMDHAVIYGSRSGQRLALVTSAGVALEDRR